MTREPIPEIMRAMSRQSRDNREWRALGLLGLMVLATGAVQAAGQRTAAAPGRELLGADSAAAARSVWRAGPGSPPAGWCADGPALRLDLPFERDLERVYWDREVTLDLSRYAGFTIDLEVDDPEAIRILHLYFRSGGGWYAARVPLRDGGRARVHLSREDFSSEGAVGGWERIEAIRFSPWKGAPRTAALRIYSLRAGGGNVLVVRGVETAAGPGEGAIAETVTRRISGWLSAACVPHGVIPDTRLGDPQSMRAALWILGFNPNLNDEQLQAIERFTAGGGRLLVFYSTDERLARLMGLRLGQYRPADPPGQWSAMVFDPAELPLAPARVWQQSWNIYTVYPATRQARIVAHWAGPEGGAGEAPAWVRSPQGYWMTHILLGDDPERKRDLLLALTARLDPSVWEPAARCRVERIGRIDGQRDLESAMAHIRAQARAAGRAADVERLLADLPAQHARVRQALERGAHSDAYQAAGRMEGRLTAAYARAQKALTPEFRGLWDHAGTGWYPGDWDRSARELAAGGITALMPNVAWGGVAHYHSEHLALSAVARRLGDQLEQSVRAARRHGLEVHAWKVCWQLGDAPREVRQQLEREDRLIRDADGNSLPWLNPADPRNRRLELDSLLEMAVRYEVAGIHLDYIRYPHAATCTSDTSRKLFEQQTGRSVARWPHDILPGGSLQGDYNRWRTAQITRFVSEVRSALRRERPDVKLSAAVYGGYPGSIASVAQDWGAWLAEDLVDFVTPMNYTNSRQEFQRLTARQMALPRARGRVFPGLGVSANESRLNPVQAIEQILISRELQCGGFMLFQLDHPLRERLLPALSQGITAR